MKKIGLLVLVFCMSLGLSFAQDDMSEPMVDTTALSIGEGTIAEYLTDMVGQETTCTLAFEAVETMSEDEEAGTSFACLLEAVQAAGLAETLMGEGPFTVFAPTDRAFYDFAQEQGADTPDALFADTEMLSSILMYHVAPDAGSLNEIYLGREAEAEVAISVMTAGGNDLMLDFPTGESEEEVVVAVGEAMGNGQAYVTGTTVDVDNGYIIPISEVLVPPME